MNGADERKNVFQYALLGVFAVLIAAGAIAFATFSADSDAPPVAASVSSLRVWGTLPSGTIQEVFDEIEARYPIATIAEYTAHDQEALYGNYLEALARGEAPDLLIVDTETLLPFADKLVPLPYQSHPLQTFRASFVEATEVFTRKDGTIAFPVAIDPLVMFWNRDMHTTRGLVRPPQYWDEVPAYVDTLTRIGSNLDIEQSAIALGEYQNIANAKNIFAALLLQAGTSISAWSDENLLSFNLQGPQQRGESAGVASLRFYTDFANPLSKNYSWNRALPEARTAFVAGDLAVYFGFLSEMNTIQNLNPNLNFDVATFPQIRGTARRTTYAHVHGALVPKSSRDVNAAFQLAFALSSKEAQLLMQKHAFLPPVRRDLLAQVQTSPYWSVGYDSAIIARTWIDPKRSVSDGIFKKMIESVLSGAATLSAAIELARSELAAAQGR